MAIGVLEVGDVAKMLNVSSITVYRLAKAGKIPARKVGRVWRFNRDVIASWLAGNTWEERLDTLLGKIWTRTEGVSTEKVKREIDLAVKEVRSQVK
jgi:excisionase family DNA binding protein